MILAKINTVCSIGYSRRARVKDVVASISHAGGEWYYLDIASMMAIPEGTEQSCGDLSDYTACVTAATDSLPKASSPMHTGLGDMIASALDSVGITKERVQALASKVGIKDCGCRQRQQAANELGAKYLGIGVTKKP